MMCRDELSLELGLIIPNKGVTSIAFSTPVVDLLYYGVDSIRLYKLRYYTTNNKLSKTKFVQAIFSLLIP